MIDPVSIYDIHNIIVGSKYFNYNEGPDLQCMIKPDMISYDDVCVHIESVRYYSHNPKALFAECLKSFSEPSPFEATIYKGESKIGIGCTIGGAGFGYVEGDDELIYMPHLGMVVIEDKVAIHNGVNIDRGTIGNTIIGSGSKIDSLVHIAHNVQIGKNCMIVAGSVIGGSAQIGEGTFIGMNVSIKQKVKIGKGCVIGAGAVVTKNVPDGQIWAGVPAKQIV